METKNPIQPVLDYMLGAITRVTNPQPVQISIADRQLLFDSVNDLLDNRGSGCFDIENHVVALTGGLTACVDIAGKQDWDYSYIKERGETLTMRENANRHISYCVIEFTDREGDNIWYTDFNEDDFVKTLEY